VHLQCHIGTDTLSLHRLGGRVTGLDFSSASIREARTLAEAAGAPIDYVESDVYAAAEALSGRQFDVVYTGVGALCWLPDIRRWAQVVAGLLRPGGRLHLREGHPMLWALDVPDETHTVRVSFPYFERAEPLVWDEDATYVETEHRFANTVTHEWNHGLGEIVTALMDEGLELTLLLEHDTVPWDALPGMMELVEVLPAVDGQPAVQEYRLVEAPDRLAATYTLQAVKRR
jgi:SAM-dependent methyltransferase